MIEESEIEFLPVDQFKHEAYFKSKDFKKLYQATKSKKLEKFSKHIISICSSKQPSMKILCAKAAFYSEDYHFCIKILEDVDSLFSTAILYEKYSLLIKAMYLDNKVNEERIKKAFKDFQRNKAQIVGVGLGSYFFNEIKQLKKISLSHQSAIQRCKQQNKRSMWKIMHDLKTKPIFDSMPSYLVDKMWFTHLEDYLNKKREDPPGPITNFRLINHIFNFERHVQQSHNYMNICLFPRFDILDYVIINPELWRYIFDIFGGIPVKRVYIKNPNYRVMDGSDNVVKIVFRIKDNPEWRVIQAQAGTYWETSVLPIFYKLYGPGQLKQIRNQKEEFLVKPGKIDNIKYPYRYTHCQPASIRAYNIDQLQTKKHLVFNYDLEKYDPKNSISKGFMGLQLSPPKSSYFNSVIQIISHIDQFSEYLLMNKYLNQLNLSNRNSEGSFGKVVCLAAQTVKDIWFKDQNMSFNVKADQLKNVVYDLFYCDKQIKENSHLCYGDYQEKKKEQPKVKENSTLKRIKQFKMPDVVLKDIERDPSTLFKILFRCMSSDLCQERPEQIISGSIQTAGKFQEKNLIEIYNRVLKQYHKYNYSIISDLFTGFKTFRSQCDTCLFQELNFQPFRVYDLTVPLDSPKQKLYYISADTIGEKAIRVQFYLQELNTLEDILKLVRKQLEIDSSSKLKALLLSKVFEIDQDQLSDFMSVKDLFENLRVGKKTLFVYQIYPLQQEQEIALITYKFTGFQQKNDVVDGFPRIVPINPLILAKQNSEQLMSLILDTIPLQVYEAPRRPYIQKITFENLLQKQPKKKKSKRNKKFYSIKIFVETKNQIKNYKYLPHKQIIGQRQSILSITLEACLRNNNFQSLIGLEQRFFCKMCQKEQNATTEDKIYETGDIFIIRLNRFLDVGNTKILTNINYPLYDLDMTEYLFDYPSKTKQKMKKYCPKDRHEKIMNREEYCLYDLIGVIIHKGSTIINGQFSAYCRLQNHRWCEFKNQLIKQIQETYVKDINAYILIYERKKQKRAPKPKFKFNQIELKPKQKLSVEDQDMRPSIRVHSK